MNLQTVPLQHETKRGVDVEQYEIARTRAQNIRVGLDDPEVDVAQILNVAHKAKDWDAQGYDDWETYVIAEFDFTAITDDAKRTAVHSVLVKTLNNKLLALKLVGCEPKERNAMAPKKLGKYQVARPLTAEEMKALEASIKENGILEPIVLDEDGNIIDGHHRQKIADKLGLSDVPTRELEGLDEDQKVAAAKELNFNRRHLNSEEKRQLVIDELLADPTVANRAIARLVGASEGTVRNIRKELEASAQITQTTTAKGADGVERKKPEPKAAQPDSDEGDTLDVGAISVPEFSDAPTDEADHDDEPVQTTEILSALGALSEAQRQIDRAAQYLGSEAADQFGFVALRTLLSGIRDAVEASHQ